MLFKVFNGIQGLPEEPECSCHIQFHRPAPKFDNSLVNIWCGFYSWISVIFDVVYLLLKSDERCRQTAWQSLCPSQLCLLPSYFHLKIIRVQVLNEFFHVSNDDQYYSHDHSSYYYYKLLLVLAWLISLITCNYISLWIRRTNSTIQ